jgi:hypothetical protein
VSQHGPRPGREVQPPEHRLPVLLVVRPVPPLATRHPLADREPGSLVCAKHRAALSPVPVPISHTRCPGWVSSAASITATMTGDDAELVGSRPARCGPVGAIVDLGDHGLVAIRQLQPPVRIVGSGSGSNAGSSPSLSIHTVSGRYRWRGTAASAGRHGIHAVPAHAAATISRSEISRGDIHGAVCQLRTSWSTVSAPPST